MKFFLILSIGFLSVITLHSQSLSNGITVFDTRTINDLPNFNKQAVRADLKHRVTIGVPGTGDFSTNLTISPFTNSNAGLSHQLNFNDGGLFYRQGDFNATSWKAWSKILLDQGNQKINTGKLEILNTANSGHLVLSANDNPSQDLTQIGIDFYVANKDHIVGRISSLYYTSIDNGSGGLRFHVRNAGVLTEAIRIHHNGNIGVGTINPRNKLDVNGTIRATEVKVETGWADFVFAEDYKLPSLSEVEDHIKTYSRLPEIPSENEVKENGVNLGEMQVKLLQKIEELTLYVIQQNKENKNLQKQIDELKNRLGEE